MAKKVIRNYVPGEGYDFLHFAEVMNLNAQKDFKEAKAMNAQGNPSSPTVAGASPRGGALVGGAVGAPNAVSKPRTPEIKAPETSPAVQGTGAALSGPAAYEKIQGDFKNAIKQYQKDMGRKI